jgi:hypothetical protein
MSTAKDYGVLTPGRALEALWQECQGDAPQALIEWFAADATDAAVQHLRNLSEVVEGIGCLVQTDGARQPGEQAGNFQDGGDVGTLLYHVSQSIETLAHLADIGDSAKYWLLHPEQRGTWGRPNR